MSKPVQALYRRRRRVVPAVLVVSVLWLPLSAPAAAVTTETFAVDMAGWTNWPNADRSWSWHEDGYVRVTFPAVPMPGHARLQGGATASGGAFVGDYRASDITIIGLDYYAEDAYATDVRVLLHQGTNSVTAYFPGGATGVWNRVAVSIVGRAAGGWFPEDDELFDHVLENVEQVSFDLKRDGLDAEGHRLDNIFIDHIHLAGGIGEESGVAAITWGNLREGWTYRLEATTNLLMDAWVELGSFLATNDVHRFSDPDMTNFPMRLYRLVVE